MYLSVDDILIAEHHQIPCKVFEKYYNLCLDTDWTPWINLINFYLKNKDLKKYEKDEAESLKKSQENVKKAYKSLRDTIKQHKEKKEWILYNNVTKNYEVMNTKRKEHIEREFGDNTHEWKIFRWTEELENKYLTK
jgi:predicted transcriptional regulator